MKNFKLTPQQETILTKTKQEPQPKSHLKSKAQHQHSCKRSKQESKTQSAEC